MFSAKAGGLVHVLSNDACLKSPAVEKKEIEYNHSKWNMKNDMMIWEKKEIKVIIRMEYYIVSFQLIIKQIIQK